MTAVAVLYLVIVAFMTICALQAYRIVRYASKRKLTELPESEVMIVLLSPFAIVADTRGNPLKVLAKHYYRLFKGEYYTGYVKVNEAFAKLSDDKATKIESEIGAYVRLVSYFIAPRILKPAAAASNTPDEFRAHTRATVSEMEKFIACGVSDTQITIALRHYANRHDMQATQIVRHVKVLLASYTDEIILDYIAKHK